MKNLIRLFTCIVFSLFLIGSALANDSFEVVWQFELYDKLIVDMAVDPQKNVYISSIPAPVHLQHSNTILTKLNSNGKQVWEFDMYEPGTFISSFDYKGNLYISSGPSIHHNIPGEESHPAIARKLDPSGNLLWMFDEHDYSAFVIEFIDGFIYLFTMFDTLRKIDQDGNQIWVVEDSGLRGFIVDEEGNVFTSSGGPLRKFGPDGKEIAVYLVPGAGIETAGVDYNGNVFATTYDNRLYKFESNGNQTWVSDRYDKQIYINAVDHEGNVYIASADGSVRKIDPMGNQIWKLDVYQPYQDKFYFGPIITLVNYYYPDMGNIYEGDYLYIESGSSHDNSIRKIDQDGNYIWVYYKSSNDIISLIDVDGNIYIASNDTVDWKKRVVRKVSFKGQPSTLSNLDKANIIFDWLESIASQVLSPTPQETKKIEGIYYRYYSVTDVYIATYLGDLWFIDHLGDLHNFGEVNYWLPFAQE